MRAVSQVGDLKARMEVNNQIDEKIKQMGTFQEKFRQFESVLKVSTVARPRSSRWEHSRRSSGSLSLF
jgi:hypothetical protein